MTDLWLNSPIGYPYAQRIEKNNDSQLKSFLIGTTADEQTAEMIRQMTHDELVEDLERNGFTFDEEYFGARLLDWQRY